MRIDSGGNVYTGAIIYDHATNHMSNLLNIRRKWWAVVGEYVGIVLE